MGGGLARVRAIGQIIPSILAALLLAAIAIVGRPTTGRPTAAAGGSSPVDTIATAASLLEQSTASGGRGYRFEIAQRSTITARPGGPRIPVPDPADPTGGKVVEVDAAYLNGLVETGWVVPDGFSMEMRSGPKDADAPADLTGGQLLFRALVRDGKTFRDDGEGWYATERPPGVGLDPRTAALLPQLLREMTSPAAVETQLAEGELGKSDDAAVKAVEASAAIANIPGVIAVDAESFTELTQPIAMTFDADGRLSGALVLARNTRMDEWDLIVVTEIVFRYDNVPKSLPEPTPVYAPSGLVTEP